MTDAQKKQSVVISLVTLIADASKKPAPDWSVIYALDQALEAVQAAPAGA